MESDKSNFDTGDLPDLDMLTDVEHEPEPAALEQPVANPPPTKPEPAQRKAPAPTAKSSTSTTRKVSLNTGRAANAKELFTILRDESDGRLILEIRGTAYRTLAESPKVKKAVMKILKEFAATITKPDRRPDPKPAPPPTTPEPAPTSAPEAPTLGELLNKPPEAPAPKPPPQKPKPRKPAKDGEIPGVLPSLKLDDYRTDISKRGFLGRPPKPRKDIPEINIGNAIEDFLQHKLESYPEFAARNLHILPDTSGGIVIQVDDMFYEAVSDVEDVEVRTFLQQTVQEWQNLH